MRIYITGHQAPARNWPYIPEGWYSAADIGQERFDYLLASGQAYTAMQIERLAGARSELPVQEAHAELDRPYAKVEKAVTPDLPFSEPVEDTDSAPDDDRTVNIDNLVEYFEAEGVPEHKHYGRSFIETYTETVVIPSAWWAEHLPANIYEALAAAGYVSSFEALRDASDAELLAIPGIGPASLRVIRETLASE